MEQRERVDRYVDIAAVVLISLATVLTAWCGYQAARWSGLQTRSYNEASAARVRSAEAAARANALQNVDVTLFLQYVVAVGEDHPAVADFIARRFRPEMRPAFEAWLATKPRTNAKAPPSPFAMPQYRLAENGEADHLAATASERFEVAQQANETADAFVRLTVIFAAVSFLAGIGTKFRYPSHAIVVTVGFIALIYGAIQLVQLPVR